MLDLLLRLIGPAQHIPPPHTLTAHVSSPYVTLYQFPFEASSSYFPLYDISLPLKVAYYYLEHRLALLNPLVPPLLLLLFNVTDCRPRPFGIFMSLFFSPPLQSTIVIPQSRFHRLSVLSSFKSKETKIEELPTIYWERKRRCLLFLVFGGGVAVVVVLFREIYLG